MDLSSLAAAAEQFFATGFGKAVMQAFWAIFEVLYPSNAPAAHQ